MKIRLPARSIEVFSPKSFGREIARVFEELRFLAMLPPATLGSAALIQFQPVSDYGHEIPYDDSQELLCPLCDSSFTHLLIEIDLPDGAPLPRMDCFPKCMRVISVDIEKSTNTGKTPVTHCCWICARNHSLMIRMEYYPSYVLLFAEADTSDNYGDGG